MRADFSSAANRDVRRILDYYRREAGASVASDFLDELESMVKKLKEQPKSFPVAIRDLRRANLHRFPYQVIFRLKTETIIRILAVRHHKRHPDHGLGRS